MTYGTFAASIAAGLAGMVVHELSHAVAAALAGRSPRYNVGRREVAWAPASDGIDATDRAIALAPQATGFVLAGVTTAAGVLSVPLVAFLVVLTGAGSIKDIQVGLYGRTTRPDGVTLAGADGPTADADE